MAAQPSNNLVVKASFNLLVKPYMVLYVSFFFVISVIGILLLPFWLLGIGQWWSRHYYHHLECDLYERSLRFKKGILVQTEKTIPLENIQDVTFVEGPILRYFHLCILKFETAGQSTGQAHDMQLVGIMDAPIFRDRIIQQREKLLAEKHGTTTDSTNDLLREIRDELRSIREVLENR
ncbi:MAG: PH domain-containing protein [Siphonobacter sp.]